MDFVRAIYNLNRYEWCDTNIEWQAYWWTVISRQQCIVGQHTWCLAHLVRHYTWAATDPPSTSCLFSQDSISHSHLLPNRVLSIDCLKQCEVLKDGMFLSRCGMFLVSWYLAFFSFFFFFFGLNISNSCGFWLSVWVIFSVLGDGHHIPGMEWNGDN